jgi:hypothetical protein
VVPIRRPRRFGQIDEGAGRPHDAPDEEATVYIGLGTLILIIIVLIILF